MFSCNHEPSQKIVLPLISSFPFFSHSSHLKYSLWCNHLVLVFFNHHAGTSVLSSVAGEHRYSLKEQSLWRWRRGQAFPCRPGPSLTPNYTRSAKSRSHPFPPYSEQKSPSSRYIVPQPQAQNCSHPHWCTVSPILSTPTSASVNYPGYSRADSAKATFTEP